MTVDYEIPERRRRGFFRHPMALWGGLLVLLFALWFGGWFAIAGYANGKIGEQIDVLQERGIRVQCDNRAIKGFPFRLGVFCDRVAVDDESRGLNVDLAGLRTAAQIYNPSEVVTELDSPARISLPGGLQIEATWDSLRSSVKGALSGLDGFSLEHRGLYLSTEQGSARADNGEIHTRPITISAQTGENPLAEPSPGGDDLDLAFRVENLSLAASGGASLALQEVRLRLMIDEAFEALLRSRMPGKTFLAQGFSGNLRVLALHVNETGRVLLRGPFSVNSSGLLSGELTIGIRDALAVQAFVSATAPAAAPTAANLLQAMDAMGKSEVMDGEEVKSVSVTIENGNMRLGLIPLGTIPPIR